MYPKSDLKSTQSQLGAMTLRNGSVHACVLALSKQYNTNFSTPINIVRRTDKLLADKSLSEIYGDGLCGLGTTWVCGGGGGGGASLYSIGNVIKEDHGHTHTLRSDHTYTFIH